MPQVLIQIHDRGCTTLVCRKRNLVMIWHFNSKKIISSLLYLYFLIKNYILLIKIL